MRGITVWLLLCLWVQSFVAPLHASNQFLASSATSADDLVVVCTGRDVRWISLSQSEIAGKFVFVDAPAETQQLSQTCPWGALADLPHWLLTTGQAGVYSNHGLQCEIAQHQQPDIAHIYYSLPPSTGPPYFL